MKPRFPKITIALFLLVLITPLAHGQAPLRIEYSVNSSFISASDPLDLIVSKMIRWGELSQDLGKLAETKGRTDEARRFGSRLRRDHKLLNQRLKDFADTEALVLDLPGLRSPTLELMSNLYIKLKNDASPGTQLVSFYSSHLLDLDRCLRLLKEQSSHRGLASLVENHTSILSQHLDLARHLKDMNP